MIQNLHQVIELIESDWQHTHVLVLGDVMIDRYIWGDVERISPEAPVPIVHEVHRNERPGGAANVAMNLVGLGARATLFGVRGDDSDGEALEHCLQTNGIESKLVIARNHPTIAKLRIIGGKQQIVRLDTERTDQFSAEVYSSLLESLERMLAEADALVLSDYAKGVLLEELCEEAIGLAKRWNVPVLVDPKQRSFTRYRGATTICPNLGELALATGQAAKDVEALMKGGQTLVSDLGLQCLVATMSEKGIAILRADSRFIAPAAARQVFDVAGAGDTVIATMALAMATDLPLESAAQLANVAAGIVVGKVGTVPVTRDELLSSLMPEIELSAREKVLDLDHLRVRVSAWRSAGQRVVFTNGCFDLLHVGHISLLEHARHEGDRLIVAINSDASVRALKGEKRPIVGECERGRILASLAVVDAVVMFDDPTPLRLIDALRPDVVVKGGDYSEDTVIGAKEVRSWGGRVKIVPTVDGFSTTKLIARAMS